MSPKKKAKPKISMSETAYDERDYAEMEVWRLMIYPIDDYIEALEQGQEYYYRDLSRLVLTAVMDDNGVWTYTATAYRPGKDIAERYKVMQPDL